MIPFPASNANTSTAAGTPSNRSTFEAPIFPLP